MYSNTGKEIKSSEQPDGDESLSAENTAYKAYKAISSFNDEQNVEIYFSPHYLKLAIKKVKRNIDSKPASWLNDEYNRDIYISPQQVKIAIKTVSDFVSPYKQAVVDTLAAGFHSIADAMLMVHLSGVHVNGPLKYLGPFSECVSEILHNPSGELMERLVCGTTVGFVKEAVNITVAVESGVAVGLLSSVGTTPAGGIATMGVVVVGAYKMANKITTPLGHMIQHQCHTMFKNSDSEKRALTQNPKQLDVSTSQMANIPELSDSHPTDLYLTVVNQQAQSVNQLFQSHYLNPIVNPVPDSINSFAITSDPGIERLQQHLASLRQTNPSSNETSKALSSSSTGKISEHLQNLANSQNSFHRTLASTCCNNFSQFTSQARPTYHFDTATEAARNSTFFSNYIFGNFCVTPPQKSQDFSFFGGGSSGSGGKSGYCDNRFGNCSSGSNGADNCRDSGSKCENKLF